MRRGGWELQPPASSARRRRALRMRAGPSFLVAMGTGCRPSGLGLAPGPGPGQARVPAAKERSRVGSRQPAVAVAAGQVGRWGGGRETPAMVHPRIIHSGRFTVSEPHAEAGAGLGQQEEAGVAARC